jgi:hypothetical protein
MTEGQFPLDGTEVLPAPLTPADCDLQDFKFLPLDVVRLRDSDMASDETPEACWAAVQLWAASWHQIPAASVPDNEQWLAKHAGYVSRGQIDPAWATVRAGALRKYIRCSDGRLYHPVVAEKAIEAWEAKLDQRWRTECGRIKKHNDRHGTKVPKPSFDEWVAAGRPSGQRLPVPGDTPTATPKSPEGRPQRVPRETHSKGQRQGQGQGQIKKENPSGSAAAAAPRPSKKAPADFQVTEAMRKWAAEHNPGVDLERETDKFRNHTFASAKTDWAGTWRNWIYKAHEDLAAKGRLPGLKETPYQQSKREAVALATGGLASRKPPTSEAPHGLQAAATPVLG